MKKTYLLASLVYLLICPCVLAGVLTGAGTEASPYLIEDVNDFDTFADPANAATYWASGVHTKLMTDIDLSGHSLTPIGNFYGVFDGNLHGISNATINLPSSNNVGFFGYAWWGSEIKDLNFTDANITGNNGVGILVGINFDGVISNCHITGTTEGNQSVGGLVGSNSYGMIENCSADISVTGVEEVGGLVGTNFDIINNCFAKGTVSGSNRNIGGLVGIHHENDISNSYTICTVTGGDNVGGLCGSSNGGSLSNCYATVVVEGDSVGGLVGCNASANVSNCYSTGEVYGTGNVGGLMGNNLGSSNVSNCYSTCIVDGTGHEIGGLVGENWGSWLNCLWDIEISGTSDGVGNEDPESFGVTGKTTAEMMAQSTFTDWDFTTPVWMMLREGEDYPRLAWQTIFAGDIAGLYGADMVDFAYLANYWGLDDCDGLDDCGRADIDGTGDVGLGDLLYVAQDWLSL